MQTYDISMAPRFTKLLDQRIAALRAVVQTAQSADEADAHDVIDFKDLATEESLAMVHDTQATHAAQELELALGARRRVEEHSYGRCMRCESPIDLRRLVALPAALYCTACQTATEHMHGSPVRP